MSVVVPVQKFREQLDCLTRWGKQIVSLEEVLFGASAIKSQEQVALTFDDGHESNHRLALPILLEKEVVATFYVVAGFVDTDSRYMTSSQLRELAAAGMNIGSHSLTHRWMPTLNADEIRKELIESKSLLEDIVQQPVVDFALPGGHYDRAVSDALVDSGYRSVATSKAGRHEGGDSPILFNRIEIRRRLTKAEFRARFRRSTLLRLQLLEAGKSCLRRTCGLNCYTEMRRFAHSILR